MAGYAKLFSSIIDSTIWDEDKDTRLVWITMLAKCDKHGTVEASIPGLAHASRITIKECENALQRLMSPDPYSRSQNDEGRRLREVDGGWTLINYEKYRGQLTIDKIREQSRKRTERYRQRTKETQTRNNHVNHAHAAATAKATATADPEADPSSLRSSLSANPSREETSLLGLASPNSIGVQESLLPSLATTVLTTHTDTDKVKKTKTKKKTKKDIAKERIAKGTPTWNAYSEAYKKRYGVHPPISARSNSLCVQLVGLLGAEDAPKVAYHYLGSNSGFYVGAGHSLVILVRDAGKLHTEWKTGRHSTQTQARETDRRQTTGDAVNSYIAKLEAKERAKKENE